MKSKLLIVFAIIVISIISILISENYANVGSSQKYQYKFWQKDMVFENNQHYLRVLFSRSDDYGKTFSEPIDMSMTDLNAHEPKMIIMHDDVILVWRDEIKNGSVLSLAKSTDFGKTFEKKELFSGARPDIKYYDKTLYLTYVDQDLLKILYSKSNDGGQTFSAPKMIFKIDWELSPYDERPLPVLDVDADKVTITWKLQNKAWSATDYNKDDSFDVVS